MTEVANAYGQRVQVGGYGEAWADSGIALARRAIELNPDEPRAWKALGLNQSQKGWFTEEISSYERALELNPSWVTPMVNLAVAAFFQGSCDRTLRYARMAVEADPLDAFARLHVGTGHFCLGLDSLAMAWFGAAREVDPAFLWPDVTEALLLLRQGAVEEARARADALRRDDPGEPWGLWLSAQVAARTGDLEASRELRERLFAEAPDWGFRANRIWVRASLGQVRLQSGDSLEGRQILDEAISEARAALERGAEEPDFRLALGVALGIAGHEEAAIEALRDATVSGALLSRREVQLDPLYAAIRHHPGMADLLARTESRRLEMLAEARREGLVGPPG